MTSDPRPPTPCAFCGKVIIGGYASFEGKPACVECWCAKDDPDREFPCYDCGRELTKRERYEGDLCDACAAKEGP